MVDLIEAIKKGIDLHSFFYSRLYGPVKFRPLSNVEIDHVLHMCVRNKDHELKEFIRDIKLKHQPKKMLTREQLDTLYEALDDMDAWIVYHAVKDFQPEEWQHELDGLPFGYFMLRSPDCYLEVSEFANKVMDFTTAPTDDIKSVIRTKDGIRLAEAVWKLNYPLADKLWELTDMQLVFLVETRNAAEKPSEHASFLDAAAKKMHRVRPMTEHELNIIKKAEEIKAKLKSARKIQ